MTIFKGMFDLINKTRQQPLSEKVAMMRDATPVLTADVLLSTEKRQKILQEIRQLLNLPDEEYQKIFFSVIQNFAIFVQNLPETERSYYSSVGGWLDHALERTALSLFLCRTYLLPEGTTLDSVSEQDLLWIYAVFTAALVYNFGKIILHHVVSLTDAQGEMQSAWLPYSGPMVGQATHYMFGFSEMHYDHLYPLITPLFARQILSLTEEKDHFNGFNWIASDSDVLQAWLALLSEEYRQVGSILAVVRIADAQLLEGYFTDRKVFRHNLSPQTIALLSKLNRERKELFKKQKELRDKMLAEHKDHEANKTPEKLVEDKKNKAEKYGLFGVAADAHKEALARQAKSPTAFITPHSVDAHTVKDVAQRFMQWLQEHLAKQTLAVNKSDALVKVVKEGVVVDQAILQKFLSEQKNTQTTTAQQLEQILHASALVNPVTYLQLMQREGGNTIQPALLINNPYLVFPHGAPPPVIGLQVFPPQTTPPPVLTVSTPQEIAAQKQSLHQQTPPTRLTFTPFSGPKS